MATAQAMPLSLLYERDETAWLEEMSRLAAEGRFAEMDHRNLSEYLADMAKRDRREVFSRLVVLLTHLLKWAHQPDRRSESWLEPTAEQRQRRRPSEATAFRARFSVCTSCLVPSGRPLDDCGSALSAQSILDLTRPIAG